MLNKIFAILIIIAVLFQYSCEMKTENEFYQEAMSVKKPQERLIQLTNFLEKYPENKNLDKILYQMFRDYISLKDESNAIIYSNKFLNFFPKDHRMSELNSVAWILAENKMGLDSAKVYADQAVAQASEAGTRTLNNIMDTQAFVYFQAGDAKKALKIQLMAMQGNEDNYDYLNRLGLYQYGAGENDNAYRTIAKSILLGGGLESGNQLTKWFDSDFKDVNKRNNYAKKIAKVTLDDFFKDGIGESKKSQGAVLLSILNVDLVKAEKWAGDAVKSLDENSDPNLYLNYNTNLAAVYTASNKHSLALKTLEKVKEDASIYDLSYWLNLGNAYLKNDQKEKSIESFINGMLWRKTPENILALENLGLNESEIETRIENKKTELINFHPPKYIEDEKYAGQTVLVELFTGAECPPCKGADLALDLISEYYPKSMVNVIEYHLHIPGPDPLTNPDSEGRYKFYQKGFGTPTVFFNGQNKTIGGGSDLVKKQLFNKYKKSIEKYFSTKPQAKINLIAEVKEENIEVNTEIEIKTKNENDLILNIAILEKSVDYTGGNGITKHAFVVRYLMTGSEGEKVNQRQSTFKYSDKININTIENRQKKYLTDFEKNPPKRHRNFSGWEETKDKINVNQLAVVAFIQNPETKEIIQSQYFEFK